MPFGTLTVKGNAIPTFAPPYPVTTHEFSDMTMVTISYRVSLASIQHLIPSVLELEAEPLVKSRFLRYGISTVSGYNEFGQQVEVTYRGKKYDYNLVLILDNESAIFAGREVFGYPKLFGTAEIKNINGTSVVRGGVQRPIGEDVIAFEFVPECKLSSSPAAASDGLSLRVIPSAVIGQPPLVQELVPALMDWRFAEVWQGRGTVTFPKKSVINPWTDVEILRFEDAFYATRGSAVLHNPTETFAI